MKRSQINLKPDVYAAIAKIAATLGYVQRGGPRAGEGSPVKLLEALSVGNLEVRSAVRSEPSTPVSTGQNRSGEDTSSGV